MVCNGSTSGFSKKAHTINKIRRYETQTSFIHVSQTNDVMTIVYTDNFLPRLVI